MHPLGLRLESSESLVLRVGRGQLLAALAPLGGSVQVQEWHQEWVGHQEQRWLVQKARPRVLVRHEAMLVGLEVSLPRLRLLQQLLQPPSIH